MGSFQLQTIATFVQSHNINSYTYTNHYYINYPNNIIMFLFKILIRKY